MVVPGVLPYPQEKQVPVILYGLLVFDYMISEGILQVTTTKKNLHWYLILFSYATLFNSIITSLLHRGPGVIIYLNVHTKLL